MGGFFGVTSKTNCVFDLFFGIDYHSHLGTRRGGMCLYSENKGFDRAIHNIENSPFRTKFERDFEEMEGTVGIGCISDNEPQPLIVRSHLGTYSLTTVGKITNTDDLVKKLFHEGMSHFLEMSGGSINQTELVTAIINQKDSIVEGLSFVQEVVEGSMSVLLMTSEGIYASRDRMGRTPIHIGRKSDSQCASFENFAYLHLGYKDIKELGPGEIVYITPDRLEIRKEAEKEMKICSFLWVYYGYPTSAYEGINVEDMRYRNGAKMAGRDDIKADIVAGVPDSGTAHAIGYANESDAKFARPFIKYTPTWPRSFMPVKQSQRNLIAKMKLIPVEPLIRDKSMVLIDDSIVRGTQLRETTDFLFDSGAKEVHVRPACPPIMYGCKYLNFSRSNSDMDLIARKVIYELEDGNVTPEILEEYSNPESEKYKNMEKKICDMMHFTSLKFNRLDDMVEAIGLPKCKVCTYCFDGKE